MHLIKPDLRQHYPMAFSARGSSIMTDDNRAIVDRKAFETRITSKHAGMQS